MPSPLNFKKPFSKISAEELKGKIGAGSLFTLLDVRPKSVFAAEHMEYFLEFVKIENGKLLGSLSFLSTMNPHS